MALDAYVNDIIRDQISRGRSSVSLALQSIKFSATLIHRATLVRIAEAAVDYDRPDDALQALDEFFGRNPVYDQHHVRALYTSAELQALRASVFGGYNRLQLVHAAIETLLRGLALAEKGGSAGDVSAYRFLVYNGSVHHWNIIRPLLRFGYRRHAIASLLRFTEALARADDLDLAWRVRHHLMIAVCCYEASAEERGGTTDYSKTLQSALVAAWDLAGRASRVAPLPVGATRLVEDVVRLATHLSVTAPWAGVTPVAGAAGGAAGATAGVEQAGGTSSKGTGGGLKPSAQSAAAFSTAQFSTPPSVLSNLDSRSRTTAALQALWSATAIGAGCYEPGDAELTSTDPASLLSRSRRTRCSQDVRTRLLDLLQVSPTMI